jgi:hypothetical protein
MSSPPDPVHLSGEHRRIVASIFRHPTSGNIEWHDILSLLGAIGSVSETSRGNYLVTVGSETQAFQRPRHKDIDTEQVLELRSFLTATGYGPGD